MTNTDDHTDNNTDNQLPDPRPALGRSIATAQSVLAELSVDNAHNATPCADWNAQMMAGHLVAVMERVEAIPSGRDPMDMALVREDIALDGLASTFGDVAQAAQAVWTDDMLDRIVTVPFGVMPGAAALAVYNAEILAHTWDLSRAIGVEPDWNREDTAVANAVTRMGLPDEGRDLEEMPFSPVVPTADDAPAIEQLVAWLGRDPRFGGAA